MKTKPKKRALPLLLSLLISIGLMPTAAFASDVAVTIPTTKWSDYAAMSFAGGDGSENNPFLISTAAQLAKLSNDVNNNIESYEGNFFQLTQDIDLSKHRWIPIGFLKGDDTTGYQELQFKGFIDGNNKTISGLIVDERNEKNTAGLFGYIQNFSEDTVGAKNLTISNAKILSDEKAGILAGYATANPGKKVVFENVTVSGTIDVNITSDYNFVGGMIGYGARINAKNCIVDGISVQGSSNSGGLIGIDSGSVFTNCKATGRVSGAWVLGGFVGYTILADPLNPDTKSVYEKCYADVTIDGYDWRLGGFAGHAEYGEFKNCVAFGDVTSPATDFIPRAGGFIGESVNVTASNCHAAGEVSSQHPTTKPGGFVGFYSANGTFTNCSFDSEKNNNNLNPAGEGTIESGVTGESTKKVLSNICMDFYGQHDVSDTTPWIKDAEPKCTTAGSESQYCTRCNEKYNTREIPATGHKDDNKDNICDICSTQLDKKPVTPPSDPFYQSGGFAVPSVHTHSLTLVSGKPAACTEDGVKDYYKCSGCGRYFEDQNAAKEIKNLNEWKVIKALGHKNANNDGICDVCGAALSSATENSTNPTYIFETDETDASTSQDNSPNTDEEEKNNNSTDLSDADNDKNLSTGNGGFGTIAVISLIFLSAMGGTAIYKQKKKR